MAEGAPSSRRAGWRSEAHPRACFDRLSTSGERSFLTAGAAGALLLWLALYATPARAEEQVRIAVTSGAASALLTGSSLAVQPIAGGSPEPVQSGRAEVTLAGGEVRVNGRAVPPPGALLTADGPIRHAGLELQGAVEVRAAEGGLQVIHLLRMEDYVAAVAGSEMPPSFPPEALKAQAVAARTFAIAKKLQAMAEGRPFHLGSTVVHQVYRGSARIDPRARAAAESTAGEVLTWHDEPADAFFHASCGGRTETGAEALGKDRPYLASVQCGRCDGTPLSRWSWRIEAAELADKLGLQRRVTAVRIVERTASGRARRIAVETGRGAVQIGGADFRQRIGWSALKSLWFDVSRSGSTFTFHGRGAGHGAGMCQWGAAGFAREGRSYREILAHYYPGTELRRMY